MRIGALGAIGSPDATSRETRVADGQAMVRILGHVVLQAAFIAPGLALFGIRGWRLAGAAIGGSATFTALSWLWAEVNGFSMTPMTPGASTPARRQAAQPPRRTSSLPEGTVQAEVIDLNPS